MTIHNSSARTEGNPEPDELWVTYSSNPDRDEDEINESNTRLSVVHCLGEHPKPPAWVSDNMVGIPYRVRNLWDPAHRASEGEVSEFIPNWHFFFRLPEDPDDFDEDYYDLLDLTRETLGLKEIALLLAGEPSHAAGGREGYEALRFFALDGISETISETSLRQGHDAGQYGKSLSRTLTFYDYPDSIIDDALRSQQDSWENDMGYDDENAAHVVEILLTREELLDEDNTDEITELVNEFELEYDEYREDVL